MKPTPPHNNETPPGYLHEPAAPQKSFLSTREAARMLYLAVGTVQKMVDDGTLKAWTTSGGHRRIHADSVHALITAGGQDKAASLSNQHLSVLIAEDDLTQCKIYEASIKGWGLPIDLRIVPDGFSALIEAGKSIPDVMLIDLVMPGMDGFELVRHICGNLSFQKTGIMVITSLCGDDIRTKGGLPPSILVAEKPVSFEMLYGFIHARLAAKLQAQLPG